MGLPPTIRAEAESLLGRLHAVIKEASGAEMAFSVAQRFVREVIDAQVDTAPDLVAQLAVDMIRYYAEVVLPRAAEAGAQPPVLPPVQMPAGGGGIGTQLDTDVECADQIADDPRYDPGRGPAFQIRHVWAYVALDPSGAEGVMAISGSLEGRAMLIPTICTDDARRDFMREHALKLGRMGRKVVKLLRFSGREELEIVYSPPKARA